MQAIRTRIVGPRASHGAKVNARCAMGTLSVPYDYGADAKDNHRAAAVELVRKLEKLGPGGWAGQWVGGYADNDMYWVCMSYKDVTMDSFMVGRDPKIENSAE